MTPDNPFLQALLAEPEDDTLRLAMADWLDEHDEPERAEFVRVQIELARGVENRDRRRHLELRQRDLLITHDKQWVAPLVEVLDLPKGRWGGWVFRRGFVEYFHMPAEVINRHGGQLAKLTPVRELFLRPCNSGNVERLCRNPWLTSVTHLYLEDVNLMIPAALALLDCPYLKNLRVLRYATASLKSSTDRFQRRFGHMLKAT